MSLESENADLRQTARVLYGLYNSAESDVDELQPRTVSWVKADGTTAEAPAIFNLGWAARGIPPKEYGLRRALWDIAFGHVSGFPLRDIAYYVRTRSFSRRIERNAIEREAAARKSTDSGATS